MKVIQVIPAFVVAGAEIMCENLVYALKNKGIDVVVVSLYTQKSAITDRLESAGVDIRYLDKKRGLDFSMIGKLKKIFKSEKVDVIHTHMYAMQYAVPAAILAGVKKRVHTVHSIATKEMGKSKRVLAKLFYKNHSVVPVSLSDTVQDSIAREYKLSKSKIPVVFNGVDLSKCNKKVDYTVKGKFRIIHIGRFMAVKNHSMLLHAFQKFHEKHLDSELVLLGDGELRPEIEKMISELSLRDSVKLLGVQANVHGFLSEADAFVLPSSYEGVPMTLIEAMGTGLPIVATAVGGVPDMLIDGESALLIPVDEDELVAAFEKLYANESLRRALGENALKASKRFSAEEMAERYIGIYNQEVAL